MEYKKMIASYAKNGGDEKKMWLAVGIADDAMNYIREQNPDKYECLMRSLNETLNGKHYNEEFALADAEKICYVDANGAEHTGAHWTIDEIETATANKTFPKGTTKWDKYVAYNAFYADLCTALTDDKILAAAYLFWFADKDWKSDGKIWDYMGANK